MNTTVFTIFFTLIEFIGFYRLSREFITNITLLFIIHNLISQ